MKKTLIIFFAINLLTFSVNAQYNESKKSFSDRFELKLLYSNVNSKQIIPYFTNNTVSLKESIYKKIPQYNFEALYSLNKIISFGMYFGYSNGTYISNKITETGTDRIRFIMDKLGRSYFYGIESNIQLLPLLLKSDNLRFNLYCPVRIGMVSQNVTTFETNTKTWDAPVFEYGTGLGVSYYFTKNLAIYGECQLGHFINNRNSQWKVGLALKL